MGSAALIAVNVVVWRRPSLLPKLRGGTETVFILITCVLVGCAIASFRSNSPFYPDRLWPLVAAAVVLAARRMVAGSMPSGRAARHVVDALVVLLTTLVVVDVRDYSAAFRYHYDFFLGPVNAMRHGHPLLVETFSQYGVGLFYALDGAFRALPLTYGGLQLLLCIAYVAEFSLVYCVLRISCRSQAVATVGLFAAVVVNLIGEAPPYVAYPSTGPLRFGLPWVVILAGALRARAAGHRRLLDATMLVAVGVSAFWSVETLFYSLAAYAGAVLVSEPDPSNEGGQHRRVLGRIALAGAVSVAAVAATSVVIRVGAGAWPDWSEYLSLVTLYATRGLGSLLIPAWSPGYLVGAFYVLSVVTLIVARPTLRQRLQPTVTATAGATAFGAAAFTYFLGRSAPSNLHHVAVPTIVIACGWWTIVSPQLRTLSRPYALFAVFAASWVTLSAFTSHPVATRNWLRDSTLVQAMQSPAATMSRAGRLLDGTVDAPWAIEGARLLRASSPPTRPVVVLLRANRLTAVLLSAHRGNALPIVNGGQDGLMAESALKRVTSAADKLPEGTAVLTQTTFMHRPSQSFRVNSVESGDAFVARAYYALSERFELRVAHRGKYGYVLLELGRRR
jgi:hypothetical protein